MADFYNDYDEGLANVNFGFAQTTTLKLINHLYDSYKIIIPSEMEGATKTTITPYYPSNPITKSFIQIDKGIKISDAEMHPSHMTRSLLRHIYWFKKLDYTVKNTNLGISV